MHQSPGLRTKLCGAKSLPFFSVLTPAIEPTYTPTLECLFQVRLHATDPGSSQHEPSHGLTHGGSSYGQIQRVSALLPSRWIVFHCDQLSGAPWNVLKNPDLYPVHDCSTSPLQIVTINQKKKKVSRHYQLFLKGRIAPSRATDRRRRAGSHIRGDSEQLDQNWWGSTCTPTLVLKGRGTPLQLWV